MVAQTIVSDSAAASSTPQNDSPDPLKLAAWVALASGAVVVANQTVLRPSPSFRLEKGDTAEAIQADRAQSLWQGPVLPVASSPILTTADAAFSDDLIEESDANGTNADELEQSIARSEFLRSFQGRRGGFQNLTPSAPTPPQLVAPKTVGRAPWVAIARPRPTTVAPNVPEPPPLNLGNTLLPNSSSASPESPSAQSQPSPSESSTFESSRSDSSSSGPFQSQPSRPGPSPSFSREVAPLPVPPPQLTPPVSAPIASAGSPVVAPKEPPLPTVEPGAIEPGLSPGADPASPIAVAPAPEILAPEISSPEPAVDLRPVPAAPPAAAPVSRPPVTALRLAFPTGARTSSFGVGAIARGLAQDDKMLALVPPISASNAESGCNQSNCAPIDLTASARPTFFVYLNGLPAQSAQFTLHSHSEDGAEPEIVHEMNVMLTDTSDGSGGIVGIQLPQTAPALQVGQQYVWRLGLLSEDGVPETVVGSLVERRSVQSPPSRDLLSQAEFYAQRSVWQDALMNLVALRQQYPDNPEVAQTWQDFIKQVGLSTEIQNAPVLTVQ